MAVIEEKNQLKANGARTSDWIEQIKDGVLYAYDLSMFESENQETEFTKQDFEKALGKVSRKIKK